MKDFRIVSHRIKHKKHKKHKKQEDIDEKD